MEKKDETTNKPIKRKRSSRGQESPAKKPKELSKSASTSSLSRGRGRPAGARRSLLAKLPEPPVTDAYKIETQPRAKLLAFGMGDAGQLGMGEDIMERKRPQPVKVKGSINLKINITFRKLTKKSYRRVPVECTMSLLPKVAMSIHSVVMTKAH